MPCSRRSNSPPTRVRTESALHTALTRPSASDVDAMARIDGDILILGVSGKMGPTLAGLIRRAAEVAGSTPRVIGAARFSDTSVREGLERDGITTVACDLLDRDGVDRLPDCPNVIYMVGQKFGTTADHVTTWATNVYAAALAAERYRRSRIVAFSTGNVYPLSPVGSAGPSESDPPGPVGEYAQSALGRERVLQHLALRHGTPMALLRLSYAVELRYGVLRDLADRLVLGQPIDLTMGYVNLIWQRDANSVALRALEHCAAPPLVLNVTGTRTLAVRELAERLGTRLGVTPVFSGVESDTALLSDACRSADLFGAPDTEIAQVVECVADWVAAGGRSLGRPTHFQEREGRF